MNIIDVTKENLQQEHICCAISNNKDCQVASKKQWLSERFEDGLVFKKGDVRGKCFIEYLPAEKAWAPVDADGYTYIDCLWVAGQFQGGGNARLLLSECIRDSKSQGKKGIVALSSKKKRPFLSDGGLYLPFSENAPIPRFKSHVKTPRAEGTGFLLYYTHQCPFTAKYAPLLQSIAAAKGIPFKAVRFESTEQAQAAPAPFTTYALFYNGEFLTHEILSEKRFEKILEEKGL